MPASGSSSVSRDKFLNFAVKKYNFLESLPAGVAKGWSMLVMNVQNFKLLFTSKEVKASESLGSFLTIGNMFGAEWDWERFWSMTALLSIVLAFMNISANTSPGWRTRTVYACMKLLPAASQAINSWNMRKWRV